MEDESSFDKMVAALNQHLNPKVNREIQRSETTQPRQVKTRPRQKLNPESMCVPPKMNRRLRMTMFSCQPLVERRFIPLQKTKQKPDIDKKKCEYMKPTIEFLGQVFMAEGFKPCPSKLQESCEISAPANTSEPQANGEIEIFMRTIKKPIKAAQAENNNWKPEMLKFLQAYRAAKQPRTSQPQQMYCLIVL
ncbi:GDP-mannose-4,6-dehydratase [Plakobranchus ocellatus]|uniref:GDP-mannose-4,6-dehydratase n=1 Tax=Plakobranchus ocellatus TaxID=259542 RepID=A0AAV3YI65_9GAST|nr:GDP-mannose-4,6-dehydratase [Plakobranchus ocellatus]